MIDSAPTDGAPTDGKTRRARAQRTAKARFGRQTRKLTEDFRTLGDIARDAVHEKLGELRGRAADYSDQRRNGAQLVQRTLEQHIQERPLKSILIAAGIGLLLGRFWLRR